MLQALNLSKKYGDTPAVRDVSIRLSGGQIVSLIGPNGAGKSSTFRMIVGLLQPDSGQVVVDESGSFRGIRREDIGFLPEERGLYQDVRIGDLLEYWGRIRGMSKKDAAGASQYWLGRFEFTKKKNDKVSTLSKGNQQKLQLAACLIHQPRFLVLDEPFSGLDPVNQELVSTLLHEQCARGVGVLLSAHQLSLVQRISDQVLIIKNGSIISDSAPDRHQEDRSVKWVVQVLFREGARPEASAPWEDEEVISTKSDGVTLNLSESSASGFYSRLSTIAAHPEVRDIKIIGDDLHQKYLSIVRNTAHISEVRQ